MDKLAKVKAIAKKKTTFSNNWDEVRRRTIADDGGRCCLCGINRKLTIHHRDEDESNNSPENLMTLCTKCHDKLPTHLFEEDFYCRTKNDGDGHSSCLRLGPAAGNIGPKNCPYYSGEHGCLLESTKVLPEENTPNQDISAWRGWEKFIKGKRFPKVLPEENARNEQSGDIADSPPVWGTLVHIQTPKDGIPWFVKSTRNWEKWWWKKENKLCLRCSLPCKQSWLVTVSKCPQYAAKGAKT